MVIFLAFITCSSTIWFRFSWIRKLAVASAFLLLIFLSNFLFYYYFTPLEGILIKTTGLYRAPDLNQAQLTNQPLLEGSKVEILQMTADGNWLKIANSTGVVGYIPTTSLRSL